MFHFFNDLEVLKCIVEVSPINDTFLVFGLVNFLGRIYFFEKVPNPLISTLSSKATASIIDSKIIFKALAISDLLRAGNSFLRDFSISYRVKVSLFLLFTQL